MKCSSLVLVFLFSVVAILTGATTVVGDEPTFRSFSGSQRTNLDCRVPSVDFPDINLAFFTEGFSTEDGSENSIRCTTKVKDRSKGRRRVRVTLAGEIVPLDDIDNTIVSLPAKTARTDSNGEAKIEFPLGDLPDNDLAVVIQGSFRGRKMEEAVTECALRNHIPCQDGPETLCLPNDERFQFQVVSRNGDPGMVSFNGTDRGSYYFFDPNNEDLVVQVLNGCGDNGHYWVFYSALTSIGFELTVTDTETGASRVYGRPLGQASQVVTDTSAFATCP